MPWMFGKQQAQERLIREMGTIFRTVQAKHALPPGDFPQLQLFQQQLVGMDFTQFPALRDTTVQEIDNLLKNEMSALMRELPMTGTRT